MECILPHCRRVEKLYWGHFRLYLSNSKTLREKDVPVSKIQMNQSAEFYVWCLKGTELMRHTNPDTGLTKGTVSTANSRFSEDLTSLTKFLWIFKLTVSTFQTENKSK
jgi:hypothetical protein